MTDGGGCAGMMGGVDAPYDGCGVGAMGGTKDCCCGG